MTGSVRDSHGRRLRQVGAVSILAAYAMMLASVYVKSAFALIILLPLSALGVLIGVVSWALTVRKDLREKGVL